MAFTLSMALQDQISGFPTKAEVDLNIEVHKEVIAMTGGFPKGIETSVQGLVIGTTSNRYPPTGGTFFRNGLSVDMLNAYADIQGVKVPSGVVDGLLGKDSKFQEIAFSDPEVSKWIGTGSEIMSTGIAQAGVYADYTVAAVKLGTMTMEAINSKEFITDAQTRAMAMKAGCTAGGAIGSIIPGVGTAIGTAVGAAVGAITGMVISAFSKPNFDKASSEQKELAEKALSKLRAACTKNQGLINDLVLAEVFALSTRWINAEMSFGYRVPLRWFESNPGLRFEYAAQGDAPYLNKIASGSSFSIQDLTPKTPRDGYPYPYGRFKCMTDERDRQARFEYGGQTFTMTGHETLGMCNFYCPEKLLGCFYPPLPMNVFHSYGPDRVISAFAARGFDIPASLQCDTYRLVTDSLKKPSGWGEKDEDGERAVIEYEAKVAEAIQRDNEKLNSSATNLLNEFQSTKNIVDADLTRTLSLMQAKQAVLMNQDMLAGEGIFSDVATRFAGARNAHVKTMNNISIAGAVGLLGFAVWKGAT